MTDNTATPTDAPATGASGALPPERVSVCFGNAARVGETPRGILPDHGGGCACGKCTRFNFTDERDHEQAWFWSERWQAMEREAEADIAAGRYTEYTNMQALIDDLTPDDEPDPHAAPTGDLALGQDLEDDV